jgi:hypothetical protein
MAEEKDHIHHTGEDPFTLFQKLEKPERLKIYKGTWTFKKFKAREEGLLVPEEKGKILNLVDDNYKIYFKPNRSIYHFIAEDIAEVIRVQNISNYKNLKIIINVSRISEFLNSKLDYKMYSLFLKSLKDKNIPHEIINFNKYSAVYINDFFDISNGYFEFNRFNNIYNYFLNYVKEKNTLPTKKVFLSRLKVLKEKISINEEIEFSRIDNEKELEKLFISFGFEIVYPEDFKNFKDQINFFYSVKTIASLTSSGLVNSIFMQPGGNLIEIVTPLVARRAEVESDWGPLNKELHNYYKNIAVLKNHLYVGIPNLNYKVKEIKNFLDSQKAIRNFLSDN